MDSRNFTKSGAVGFREYIPLGRGKANEGCLFPLEVYAGKVIRTASGGTEYWSRKALTGEENIIIVLSNDATRAIMISGSAPGFLKT